MDELLTSIASRRARLDQLRPLSQRALDQLEHYYDVELTYTSDAIEGNTLSAVKTTLVIEKGITIGGKPLKDHLEALDHHDAIRYVRELARQATPLTESDVRNLHKLVARPSAMTVEDVYWRHRRLWVRLHEKGGEEHSMPCHHNLETYLQDYIEAAGLAGDREGRISVKQTLERLSGLIIIDEVQRAGVPFTSTRGLWIGRMPVRNGWYPGRTSVVAPCLPTLCRKIAYRDHLEDAV